MDPSLRCHGVNIVPGVGEAHGAHGKKVGDYHEGDVVPKTKSQTLLSNLRLSRSLQYFPMTLAIFIEYLYIDELRGLESALCILHTTSSMC